MKRFAEPLKPKPSNLGTDCRWGGCSNKVLVARKLCSWHYKLATRKKILNRFPLFLKKISKQEIVNRFWLFTDKKGPSECWIWKLKLANGYGMLKVNKKTYLAHRLSQEINGIKFKKGFVTDHICRNRACVNPSHLRQVTLIENVMCGESIWAKNARKTHCKNGHILSGDNLYINKKRNGRDCKICRRINSYNSMERKNAASISL